MHRSTDLGDMSNHKAWGAYSAVFVVWALSGFTQLLAAARSFDVP